MERGNQSYAEFQMQRGCKIEGKTNERKRVRDAVRRRTTYGERDPGPRTHLALSIHSLFPLGRPSTSPRVLASLCEPLRSDNLFDTCEENRTPFRIGLLTDVRVTGGHERHLATFNTLRSPRLEWNYSAPVEY